MGDLSGKDAFKPSSSIAGGYNRWLGFDQSSVGASQSHHAKLVLSTQRMCWAAHRWVEQTQT